MTEQNTPVFGKRNIGQRGSVLNGFLRNCPCCGDAKIFSGYLKLKTECPKCSAPVGQIRADDFPPYLTILIVGHIIIPLLVYIEAKYQPDMMLQVIGWCIVTMVMTLTLLPYIKGTVVGFMWKIGMKGNEQR